MHLRVIPSCQFTSQVPCRMALQANLGPAGEELHGARDPGTTTACSCFLIFIARCLSSLIHREMNTEEFCFSHCSAVPRDSVFPCMERQASKSKPQGSKEDINTQNLIPPFSSLYLLVWQCGHEGEKVNPFSFHCFLCCQKHISPWPWSGLHLGLIIIECGLLTEVVDSNQCFSVNSFVTTIFKITHFSSLL